MAEKPYSLILTLSAPALRASASGSTSLSSASYQTLEQPDDEPAFSSCATLIKAISHLELLFGQGTLARQSSFKDL